MASERCSVCWLPASTDCCSSRCRGLAAKKRAVFARRQEIETAVLNAVAALRPNTTVCPGVLAQTLLEERGIALEARDALAILRELYFDLRTAQKIRFLQKGVVVPPGKTIFKGPFRLGRRS